MKELLIYSIFLLAGFWLIKNSRSEFKYLVVPVILWLLVLIVFLLLLPLLTP